eukprot:14689752-Alexandrium_andersonii.AAC.1
MPQKRTHYPAARVSQWLCVVFRTACMGIHLARQLHESVPSSDANDDDGNLAVWVTSERAQLNMVA